jgi:hypothetical protein
MLEQLLALLRAGTAQHIDQLALRLETTPQLVFAMLDELTRLGYLEPLAGNCVRSCGGCGAICARTGGAGSRTWTLTAKGAAHGV